MVQYETDLAFKNHQQFFQNLNKDMDYLRQVSRLANDFNRLPKYYEELENLSVHYACYIDEGILKELKVIKEILITNKYQEFLGKKMPEKEYGEYYQSVLDCIDKLKEVHSKFSKCLHDHELFPKLAKKEKKDKTKSLYS